MINRLLRGGSYDDDSWYLPTYMRDRDSREYRNDDLGFRLVIRRNP